MAGEVETRNPGLSERPYFKMKYFVAIFGALLLFPWARAASTQRQMSRSGGTTQPSKASAMPSSVHPLWRGPWPLSIPSGWPSLPMANHTVGAPSFAAFCEEPALSAVEGVGGRLMAPWAPPFTPRVPETKSSSHPHSPAPAQTRRENRSDNCSSANLPVSPSDLASPDCGAYSAVSLPASSLSKR
jgi:hypothetical protein